MSPEHEKALKGADFTELFAARLKLQGRRNLAIFAGVISFAIIFWLRLSLWLCIVPAIMWLGASGQHLHIKLIDLELAARKSQSDLQK